jgi:hypothetical protein
LEKHPELESSVRWSHNAQCYFRVQPGRSVEWDSETQTLVYNYDHFWWAERACVSAVRAQKVQSASNHV